MISPEFVLDQSIAYYPEDRLAQGPGAFIAVQPPDWVRKELQVEGGESADKLHYTLAFIPDASNITLDQLVKIVLPEMENWINTTQATGVIDGYGLFVNPRSTILYAKLVGDDIYTLEASIKQRLVEHNLISPSRNSAFSFVPHMTLFDLPLKSKTEWQFPPQREFEFWFDTLIIGKGAEWRSIQFVPA